MERQVFISYAAGDPAWTEDMVERLATSILNAGVPVRFDAWHLRDAGRLLSPSEWREWMADSLKQSTNVICLMSERYSTLWERKEADAGGFGVAFESIRIEHALYFQKYRNQGRILTLRLDESGYDYIPQDLAFDCPHYCWPTQRDILVSHLRGAGVAESGAASNAPEPNAPQPNAPQTVAGSQTALNSELLRHQAEHAANSLQRASGYWAGLCTSDNLKDWLPAQCLGSPSHFIEELPRLSPAMLPRVMRELRAVFKDKPAQLPGPESGDAAFATVACYLFCACLLIKAEAGDMPVGLPTMDSPEAARLLASLIALVMAGGRLELRSGSGVLPEGVGTYCIQLCSENDEADFERQLYAMLVLNPWSAAAGLKTGSLSEIERAELLTELQDLRGDGYRTKAMCFVVESDTRPETTNFGLAQVIRVPVFHAHETVSYTLLGMNEAMLMSNLNLLWVDVSSYMTFVNPQTEHSQPTPNDLMRELQALVKVMNQHAASKDIQDSANALQHAVDAKQAPGRDVLAKTRETLENLTQVGDAGERLVTRLLQLLNFFM